MNDDTKTTQRASAKLPRGFGDRGPAEIAATEKNARRDQRVL
ncbi:protein of unknown function [Methylocella tundrae]|uniref:Uncharacterized protein n=1 Tax=Methylocella tundrae TaxID=227605 RepID=A0A4U8Z643_METTU|nr:protein of unknown function [Methylocella tundrae]